MDRGKCQRCPTLIIWVKNENGKAEPFDATPTRVLVLAGEKGPRGNDYDIPPPGYKIEHAHLNHFLTCKEASSFRKPAKKEKKTKEEKQEEKQEAADNAPLPEGAFRCAECGTIFGGIVTTSFEGKTLCPMCTDKGWMKPDEKKEEEGPPL